VACSLRIKPPLLPRKPKQLRDFKNGYGSNIKCLLANIHSYLQSILKKGQGDGATISRVSTAISKVFLSFVNGFYGDF